MLNLQPSAKEEELRETVEQLSRKLEAVERARRTLEFDIDRLQAQLGRASMELVETQRKLAHSENALQVCMNVEDNVLKSTANEQGLHYLLILILFCIVQNL